MAGTVAALSAAVLVATAVLALATEALRRHHRSERRRDEQVVALLRPWIVAALDDPASLGDAPGLSGRGRRIACDLLEGLGESLRGSATDELSAVAARLLDAEVVHRDLGARRSAAVVAALRAAALRREPDVEPRVVALLQHRDPWVRVHAVRALGALGGAASADALVDALAGDSLPQAEIAAALSAMGEPAVVPVRRGLRSPVVGTRRVCASLAGGLGAVGVLEDLVGVLRLDPDPAVRAAAARSLGAHTAVRARPHLELAVWHDPDPSVRAGCVEALGRVPLPTERQVLAVAAADPDPRVAGTARLLLAGVTAEGAGSPAPSGGPGGA